MDNLFIYYPFIKNTIKDSIHLKDLLQNQLTTIIFLHEHNLSYYTNTQSDYANQKLIEFEEFKLNWLKEKVKEYKR